MGCRLVVCEVYEKSPARQVLSGSIEAHGRFTIRAARLVGSRLGTTRSLWREGRERSGCVDGSNRRFPLSSCQCHRRRRRTYIAQITPLVRGGELVGLPF
jgi:hypothetical protein